MKPIIYVSLPIEYGKKIPAYLDTLHTAMSGGVHQACEFYYTNMDWEPQLIVLEEHLPPIASTPQLIMDMLQVPPQMLLGLSDEVRSWGTYVDYRHKVWRDLFMLLRASVVVVDLNMDSANQQCMDLVVASMRGVPVIGIRDLPYVPVQTVYCCDVVMPSHNERLAHVVSGLLPIFADKSMDVATPAATEPCPTHPISEPP